MTSHQWAELDRAKLSELLPRAIVVLSLGAVEQHGDHLPTGTDALLSQAISQAATTAAADQGVELIMAPPQWVGASDHHLPFGGTISLRAGTYLALLIDLLTSMTVSGAQRILILNGHGGNTGACHAAAAAVTARHEVAIAHLDYWKLVDSEDATTMPVPGHAGAFETSMIMAVRPELIQSPPTRQQPTGDPPTPFTIHTPDLWRRLDGWTDNPAAADAATGTATLTRVVEALTRSLIDWSQQ